MPESNPALQTRPVSQDETFMQERFTEAIAEQSKLMDTFAQQLLVVELAIPGLYATSLKLISGSDKLNPSLAIYITFSCWLLALILTVLAMIPRPYNKINRNSPASIEAFFNQAAQRKLSLLIPSLTLFILGIACILWDLII